MNEFFFYNNNGTIIFFTPNTSTYTLFYLLSYLSVYLVAIFTAGLLITI